MNRINNKEEYSLLYEKKSMIYNLYYKLYESIDIDLYYLVTRKRIICDENKVDINNLVDNCQYLD